MKFRYIWTALVAVMVALGVTTSATAFADELRDIPECADDNDNDGDGLTDCDDTNGDEDCTATKQCNNGGAAGSTDDPVCANDACMEAHLKRFHSLNAFKREVQKHLHTSLETDACDWFTDDGVTSTYVKEVKARPNFASQVLGDYRLKLDMCLLDSRYAKRFEEIDSRLKVVDALEARVGQNEVDIKYAHDRLNAQAEAIWQNRSRAYIFGAVGTRLSFLPTKYHVLPGFTADAGVAWKVANTATMELSMTYAYNDHHGFGGTLNTAAALGNGQFELGGMLRTFYEFRESENDNGFFSFEIGPTVTYWFTKPERQVGVDTNGDGQPDDVMNAGGLQVGGELAVTYNHHWTQALGHNRGISTAALGLRLKVRLPIDGKKGKRAGNTYVAPPPAYVPGSWKPTPAPTATPE